ncbi:MAG: copper-binding protein [Halieaceae bacterium]|jgi:Cu(I)/Ag(I) efflux system protein CusF
MRRKKILGTVLTPLALVLYFLDASSEELVTAAGQPPLVLDASQHPASPSRDGKLFDEILALDAELPWIERFNGDETWNASIGQEFLSPAGSVANGSTQTQDRNKVANLADGYGVIKSIRPEQNKIGIAHGPIDKYGMPAMSMVFKVKDPKMLEELKKGQEIGFDVDSTDAGFVITRIEVKE